jgi:hypothetical protein
MSDRPGVFGRFSQCLAFGPPVQVCLPLSVQMHTNETMLHDVKYAHVTLRNWRIILQVTQLRFLGALSHSMARMMCIITYKK